MEKIKENNKTGFINEVLESYDSSDETKQELADLLAYLLDKGIIPEKTQMRYLIANKYPKILERNGRVKRQAIFELNEITGVPESTIKCWLERFSYFSFKK